MPWFGGIGLGIEISWQVAADFAGSDFRLRIFTRAFGVGAREVGVHAIYKTELPVAAYVIVVGMGVEDHNRARGEAPHQRVNIADTHPAIEEQRLLGSDDEVADGFFGLMRLVNRVNALRGFVILKPRVADFDALERFVFGAG